MSKYIVEATITGMASCVVEANSKEDAIRVAHESGDWETNDWDLNTDGSRGGWIDAMESE